MSATSEALDELGLLREVAACAEWTLIEQRREFARGDIADLDKLEDALNAWKESAKAGESHG